MFDHFCCFAQRHLPQDSGIVQPYSTGIFPPCMCRRWQLENSSSTIIGWIGGWLLVGYGAGGHLTRDVPRWKLAKARQNACTGQPWQPLLSHGRHGAPPPAPRHTTIRQHAMRQVYVVKTRKTILIMINLTIMCTTCRWRWCGCRRQCLQVLTQ